ncbi:sulfotransferase family protein [Paracoccus tegillarcae]|uniref:Sulfotransferase n=1 Tax=Paracoccus tegillarcae TaxID=1529068 RepID=A0A2K9EKA6_9RHOB|nr:sulfotransferase [Paracoccus tegillarcae]AUH33827.1 sulfotransferase [Paracoccus tegillarcae]
MTTERETDWNAPGKPRKPTILGIGAQKAGTTWLSQMLSQHPKVWTPPFKEVQLFSHRFVEEHRQWLPWHFRRARQNIEKRWAARGEPMPQGLTDYLDDITAEPMFTDDWYKRIFAPAPRGNETLDISPEYSTIPDEGVDFVRDFLPRTRFIYLIRQPVDRVISQMKMHMTRKKQNPRTAQPWLDLLDDPALYNRGNYAEYVPRWQSRFGPDRLLILPFGRIATDPAGLLAEIETFLDLPPFEYVGLHRKVFAAPEELSAPGEVRDILRERLKSQFDFLEANLPAEFCKQLR